MGLVTEALTEWLCRVGLCRVLPAIPLPKSYFSAAKETQGSHSWRALAPSFQQRHAIFQFAVMKSPLTSGPAAECYSGASLAVPLWPSCSFSVG